MDCKISKSELDFAKVVVDKYQNVKCKLHIYTLYSPNVLCHSTVN